MDISAIYKDNKLYKLSAPDQPRKMAKLMVPEGFNEVATLYEYIPAAKLPDELAGFLQKVIEGGMKLDPGRVLTANTDHTDVSLQKLAEQAKAKTVIIFGLNWLDGLKNANIRKNEIVKLYGMKVLVTDPLDVINTNDAAKKAFWSELKKLF